MLFHLLHQNLQVLVFCFRFVEAGAQLLALIVFRFEPETLD